MSSLGVELKPNQEQDKRDFLTRIIFRLDFSANVDVSEKKRRAFSTAIEEEFSAPQLETRKSIQFTMGEEGNFLAEGQARFYHFTNKDGTRKVILEPTALVVLFFSGANAEELSSTLNSVGNGFNEAYEKMTAIRTGLRYTYRLDKFGHGPLDWNRFISKNLTSTIDFYSNPDELAKVISSIELTKENYRVTMQAGLANSIDYPNPIRSGEFVLDYDCYSAENKTIPAALELIDIFNKEISDLFILSTTEELRRITEEQNA